MGWWHTIELPNGEVTPGLHDYRGAQGNRFLLPEDLTGKSVLDFGTWDGFWAIEAKRRGASEVVAADRWAAQPENCKLALGAYEIPYRYSGDLDFPLPTDLLLEWKNHFDVVLFYGILYHLKNPYIGLLNAASCCKPEGMVIVESAVNQGKLDGLNPSIPLLWVIDGIHDGDPTNYFMPNPPAILQLCRLAGLNPVEGEEENYRFTVRCRKEIYQEKGEDTVTNKKYIYYAHSCEASNTEIEKKDQEIAKLECTLRETQRTIASLYASRSWRVTRPLRLIDNGFRKLCTSPALFRDLFAWEKWRATGWPGLILRLKKLFENGEEAEH